MKRRNLKGFWTGILVFLMLYSFSFAEGNGGFAGSFLRIGLGARALGMGNAQVAGAVNGFGMFYNPAALPRLQNRLFSLSYSFLSLDRRFDYIGISAPLPPFAGFSVGWIYSGVTDLRSYNSRGEDTGELSNGLNAVYFSFGLNLIQMIQQSGQLKGARPDLLSIGLSVKYLRESVDDHADFNYVGSGLGVDLGVMVTPAESFSFGYQIKDINSNLRSNTNKIFERGSITKNRFPLIQKVGIWYRTPYKGVSLAYDFEWSDAGQEKHHVGAEFATRGAVGRVGYDNNHLTLGGGLDFRVYRHIKLLLDYAFVDSVIDEGVSHVFSWQFIF